MAEETSASAYSTIRPRAALTFAGEAREAAEGLPTLRLAVEDSAPGQLVVRSTLGEGGMGLVRVAWQRALSREVAVKTLRADRLSGAHVDGLRKEAELLARLEHPNVVPVHSLGRCQDEGPVLVMKRVEGVSWSTLLREPEHRAWASYEGDRLERHLDILAGVANATHFAHSHGVVHRDIKPHNVMVGDFGEVYLVDWGIALDLSLADARPVAELVGSPAYMAPEQVNCQATDARTDVFLLGATLHEVLTGRPRNSGASIPEAMCNAAEARLFHYPPEVPTGLGEICNKACAKDPTDRYPDVGAFLRELADFRQHRSALEIAESASRGLVELRRACDAALAERSSERTMKVQRVFSRCRFGFDEALRQRPGTERAVWGLQACLELMIDYELRGLHPRSAQVLLEALPYPSPTLQSRTKRALAQFDDEEDARHTLAAMHRSLELRGQTHGRARLALLNGVGWLVMLCGISAALRAGWIRGTPVQNLVFGLGWLGLGLCARWFVQRWMGERIGPLATSDGVPEDIFSRFMLVTVLLPVAGLINRLYSFMVERTLHEAIMGDYLIVLTALATATGLLERKLWVSTALACVAALLAAAYPPYALDVAGVLALVVGWRVATSLRPGATIAG